MRRLIPHPLFPMKTCRDCGLEKPWTEFHRMSGSGRPRERCKPCMRAYNKAHRNPENHAPRASGWERKRRADPTWERREVLKRLYSITPEQYDEMYAAQGGLCAICQEPESVEVKKRNRWTLAVDHDHVTGAIRGLLCNRCNLILGKAHDDAALLRVAAAYLEG